MSAQVTQAPTMAQSVWLVAQREIGSKFRSKAFLISTIILFLGALALVIWGGIQAGATNDTRVAVTADAQQYVHDVPGLEVTDASDRPDAEALVTAGDVDAAIVGDPDSPVVTGKQCLCYKVGRRRPWSAIPDVAGVGGASNHRQPPVGWERCDQVNLLACMACPSGRRRR